MIPHQLSRLFYHTFLKYSACSEKKKNCIVYFWVTPMGLSAESKTINLKIQEQVPKKVEFFSLPNAGLSVPIPRHSKTLSAGLVTLET